jgi:hypothetical protein
MKKFYIIIKIIIGIVILAFIDNVLMNYYSEKYLYILEFRNIIRLIHLALAISIIASRIDTFIDKEYSFYKMIAMPEQKIMLVLLKTILRDGILLSVIYGLLLYEKSIIVYIGKMLGFMTFIVVLAIFLYFEKYFFIISINRKLFSIIFLSLTLINIRFILLEQGVSLETFQMISKSGIINFFNYIYERFIWSSPLLALLGFRTLALLDNKCLDNKIKFHFVRKVKPVNKNKNIFINHSIREIKMAFRYRGFLTFFVIAATVAIISLLFLDSYTAMIILTVLTTLNSMLMVYVYRADTFNQSIYSQVYESYNLFIINKV